MNKLTKEEILQTITNFYKVMNYIYNERLVWFENVGNADKAISDIRHAVENDYDGNNGDKYIELLYLTTKERRANKDLQELFLPVFNVWKESRELQRAIENMEKYYQIMQEGRKYQPKVLHELFEEE